MHITKKNRKSPAISDIFKKLAGHDLHALLDFSVRLLMPWAGLCYARAVVQDSDDARMLLRIVANKGMFDGTEEDADWRHVVGCAVRACCHVYVYVIYMYVCADTCMMI